MEHDREMKRLKEKTADMVLHEDIETLNQKLNYLTNDDYIAGNNAPLKLELKQEIKKTVEMIVSLELQLNMGYVSKDDLQA